MRNSAIVGRLVAARNVLGEECAYPGSSFGSEDADAAWEELWLAVDEIEAEWKSSVTEPGVSFRQDLVKAIAPVVLANLYKMQVSAQLSDETVALLTIQKTNKIVDTITGFPESAVEGMENAIAKLSQAAQLPQPSEDRVAHRERLVEAISPKVVERTFSLIDSNSDPLKAATAPTVIGVTTKAIVDAILEAENATNP